MVRVYRQKVCRGNIFCKKRFTYCTNLVASSKIGSKLSEGWSFSRPERGLRPPQSGTPCKPADKSTVSEVSRVLFLGISLINETIFLVSGECLQVVGVELKGKSPPYPTEGGFELFPLTLYLSPVWSRASPLGLNTRYTMIQF